MANRCAICGINTIFYIWSTSRNFNKRKLVSKIDENDKEMKYRLLNESYPVCFKCVEENELLK